MKTLTVFFGVITVALCGKISAPVPLDPNEAKVQELIGKIDLKKRENGMSFGITVGQDFMAAAAYRVQAQKQITAIKNKGKNALTPQDPACVDKLNGDLALLQTELASLTGCGKAGVQSKKANATKLKGLKTQAQGIKALCTPVGALQEDIDSCYEEKIQGIEEQLVGGETPQGTACEDAKNSISSKVADAQSVDCALPVA